MPGEEAGRKQVSLGTGGCLLLPGDKATAHGSHRGHLISSQPAWHSARISPLECGIGGEMVNVVFVRGPKEYQSSTEGLRSF